MISKRVEWIDYWLAPYEVCLYLLNGISYVLVTAVKSQCKVHQG